MGGAIMMGWHLTCLAFLHREPWRPRVSRGDSPAAYLSRNGGIIKLADYGAAFVGRDRWSDGAVRAAVAESAGPKF